MKKLNKGDVIACFSPSVPGTAIATERYNRSKRFLKQKGFNILDGKLTGKKSYYRSGSTRERVEELNLHIRNSEVKCIISTIGGLNSNSLLPYIDYDSFKKNPKIIVGYSDVTAILLAIYKKTGITTFYGPAMIPTFGELEPYSSLSFRYFEQILVNDCLPLSLEIPEFWTEEFIDWTEEEKEKRRIPNNLVTIHTGEVTGRLIGGNLETLLGIWGTEYMPDILEGDILFLEDGMHGIEETERSVTLLKLSGVFNNISGLIIGKHELFNDRGTGKKYYEVIMEVVGPLDIPILAEFDCGHTKPMYTLPIGGTINLNATKQVVSILDLGNI